MHKDQKPIYYFVIILIIVFTELRGFEIRDCWYYVDGEKYFIKGIGYETHTRPGQVPWNYEFNPEIISFDLQRIKNAGFNTIRTWDALSEDELALVQKSGLKVLFGIWIDPHGNFGDSDFINNALNYVGNVIAYTKNYSCILAYIIMNEPQVNDVINGGPENLVSLWQSIIELIQQEHPGIPVTISNTAVGDYIRSDLFQIGAYNLYIYNPVLISNSHGYAGYCQFIKQHRSKNTPLIITEFGLSVSPGQVNDDYTYGGNTLDQQVSGNLLMYRGLIDGGAQGGCVFQYHDGWWKGGDENTHNDNPEEWFGLIEFDSHPGLMEGTPRPVWQAFSSYNQAIIYQPKNQQIYERSIPIELFLTDSVSQIAIELDGNILRNISSPPLYLYEEITPNIPNSIKDVNLNFIFSNERGVVIKEENIRALLVQSAITLPSVNMLVLPDNLATSDRISIVLDIVNKAPFSIKDNKLDYVFFPHIGFSPGEARSAILNSAQNTWQFTDNFQITDDVMVATLGAGYTIEYGSFQKRIFTEKIIFRDDWAGVIKANENSSSVANNQHQLSEKFILYQNYPNPFNSSTTVTFNLPRSGFVRAVIFDISGRLIATLVNQYMLPGTHQYRWQAEDLSSGVYFLYLQTEKKSFVRKLLLLK